MSGYGAVCCALVWRLLPDTLPRRNRVQLGLAGLLQRYAVVLRDRGFLTFAMMGGLGMFGMFAYIGGSPPVLIQRFGFSPAQYGMVFGASAAAFILGSQISPRLLPRFGASRIVRTASITYLAAALAIFVCARLDVGGVFGVVVPVGVSMGSMGFIMPNSAVGALSRHAAHAGSASALIGTIQFCLAALSGMLVGMFSDGTPRPMALLMLLGAIGVIVADRLRPAPRLELAAPPR